MTGLTQQDQKQNSPFTLEATLEEEPKVNNSYINNAIPFDKCIEADKQADEEAKKRKWYSQLGTAKTTKEQCEREIKEWLGTDIISELPRLIEVGASCFNYHCIQPTWLV